MISMNLLLRMALVSASLAFGTVAFAATPASAPAKSGGTRQNHHCKQADGTMDLGKTRKACLADKGTWTKDGAATSSAPASASAANKS